MASQWFSRITEFAAYIKDCGIETFRRFPSLLRQLSQPSANGMNTETPVAQPDRGRAPNLWKLMASLSVTGALEVAVLYLQDQRQLPMEFTLFSLAVLLGFACLFLSACIYPSFHNRAQLLQKLGVFLTFSAVFILISFPFPYYMKVISWVVYVITNAAVLIIRCRIWSRER